MSKEDIRYEINKILDRFSEKSLKEFLSFLKSIETKKPDLFNSDALSKILTEDKELLTQLAS